MQYLRVGLANFTTILKTCENINGKVIVHNSLFYWVVNNPNS